MRYLVVLVVGLVCGALLATIGLNALQRKHAWPRALMTTMRHVVADTRAAMKQQPCNTELLARSREHLRLLGHHVEPAVLGPDASDRVFSQYSRDFGTALDAWDASAACPQQAEALQRVGQACDGCHRDYR